LHAINVNQELLLETGVLDLRAHFLLQHSPESLSVEAPYEVHTQGTLLESGERMYMQPEEGFGGGVSSQQRDPSD
jgi:hypothetical protein